MKFNIEHRLMFAQDALLAASNIIMAAYQNQISFKMKQDLTPVTPIDLKVEKFIREMICSNFPNDGLVGEEFGKIPTTSGYTWTIDPIDGTIAYLHGLPLFASMLGLLNQECPVMGVIHFPALNEIIYATHGQGTYWKKSNANVFSRCTTSNLTDLSRATFCHSGINYFTTPASLTCYKYLKDRVQYTRSWGDAYGHMLVATGRADIMVDPLLNLWDIIPIKVIVEESGGHFDSFQNTTSIYEISSGITFSNHQLAKQVMQYRNLTNDC